MASVAETNHQIASSVAALTRRSFLQRGVGLGLVAAGSLMGAGALAQSTASGTRVNKGHLNSGHYPARARRVISIQMCGAVSQVDSFDYKPQLIKMHGQEIPPSVKSKGGRISAMSNAQSAFPLVKPLRPFRQYGESGRWVSDLFPCIGRVVDDIAFIHSMKTEHVNHDPASMFLHTGFQLSGRPSAGAWVNYALGTDNANVPSFIVMKSQHQSSGTGTNSGAWGSGFLPSHYQGVEFRAGAEPVPYIGSPEGVNREQRRAQLDVIDALAKVQYGVSGDPEILSKATQYEMAYRMQDSIPNIADISGEPKYILDMYGPEVHKPGTFARNCLLTRRLVEQGVKFVQLIQVGWDHHARIAERHPPDCMAVDQPSAALIADLKQRGLLEDTLVIWGGEFGRTSYAQGSLSETMGRDHHGGCFTYLLAGGGVRGGVSYGETDEFSYNIVKDPVTIHDLHATMLYLLGVDHERLTYHYQGRDFRLTDVSGRVVKGILA
jgi:hypothetical protein